MLPLQTRVNPLDLMVESGHLTPQRPGAYDIRAFLLRGERLWGDDRPIESSSRSSGRRHMTPLSDGAIRHGPRPRRRESWRRCAPTPDVELVGVFEPDAARRAALDRPGSAFHGVRWLPPRRRDP